MAQTAVNSDKSSLIRQDVPLSAGELLLKQERQFRRRAILVLTILTIGVFLFCILSGHYNCTRADVLRSLGYGILDRLIWLLNLPGRLIPGLHYTIVNPVPVTWASNVDSVVWDVRMIRIIAVIFIGGGLSLSGGSYQCLFRNPLVSESILGVSTGACFGASLALLMELNSVMVNLFAFAGGATAVTLTYSCSQMLKGNQTLLLVLTGTVVSSLFSAGISIVKYVAPTETTLPEITFWLMGAFSKIQKADLCYLIPVIVACAGVLIHFRWKMNVLSLGDNEARALGIDLKRTRLIIIICSTLITSVSVCVCGAISWVGMIIPQIVRYLVGPDCRRLMPCSFAAGGIFLMLVDVACRASVNAELPVSIVTSLIGAPGFFLILLKAKEAWA